MIPAGKVQGNTITKCTSWHLEERDRKDGLSPMLTVGVWHGSYHKDRVQGSRVEVGWWQLLEGK